MFPVCFLLSTFVCINMCCCCSFPMHMTWYIYIMNLGGTTLILFHVEDSPWSSKAYLDVPNSWILVSSEASKCWGMNRRKENSSKLFWNTKACTLAMMKVSKKAYSLLRYSIWHIQITLKHSHLKFSVAVMSLLYSAIFTVWDDRPAWSQIMMLYL